MHAVHCPGVPCLLEVIDVLHIVHQDDVDVLHAQALHGLRHAARDALAAEVRRLPWARTCPPGLATIPDTPAPQARRIAWLCCGALWQLAHPSWPPKMGTSASLQAHFRWQSPSLMREEGVDI